jgi:hypothetical protein
MWLRILLYLRVLSPGDGVYVAAAGRSERRRLCGLYPAGSQAVLKLSSPDAARRRPAAEGDQRSAEAQHGELHTMDTYTEVAQELADAAAVAIAAFVPARTPAVTALCQHGTKMIADTNQGARATARTPRSGAEARGFEPRMGVNPNRISSAAP